MKAHLITIDSFYNPDIREYVPEKNVVIIGAEDIYEACGDVQDRINAELGEDVAVEIPITAKEIDSVIWKQRGITV